MGMLNQVFILLAVFIVMLGLLVVYRFINVPSHIVDDDGSDLFKTRTGRGLILFVHAILFFNFILSVIWERYLVRIFHSLGASFNIKLDWAWIAVSIILYILYTLRTINNLSYCIKLTEDRMIISTITRSRSFLYAQMGAIYILHAVGRLDIFDKKRKLILSTEDVVYMPVDIHVFCEALRRRTEKYGVVYEEIRAIESKPDKWRRLLG